jgi:hypothetical protein
VWEYAAVWGLSKMLGRPGYVPLSMLTSLGELFLNLSLPALEDIAHCELDLGSPVNRWSLRPIDTIAEKYKEKHILLQPYSLLPEPVIRFKSSIHEEFKMRPGVMREVQSTLKKLNAEGKVLIGVHVRRTDFAQFLPKYFNTSLVGEQYFKVRLIYACFDIS